MALGKVTNYLRNLGKSVIYSTHDEIAKIAPATIEYADTNAQLAKNVVYAIRDFRGTLNRTKEYIKSTKVYEAADVAFANSLDSIKTGAFYSKERETRAAEKYGGDTFKMDDFDADFGDLDKELDFGNDKGFEDNLNDGDKALIAATEGSAKANAEVVANAVIKGAKATAEVSKANAGILFAQNERLFGRLTSGVSAVQAEISNINKFNVEAMGKHLENSTKFYDTVTKLSQERNAMLKELLDMERERYKAMQQAEKQKDSKNKHLTFSELVSSSGAVNFTDYFKEVGKNAKTLFEEMGGGMFNMFGDDSNGLAMLASNPLSFIPAMISRSLIGPKLKRAAEKFDSTISGVFGTLMARMTAFKKDTGDKSALFNTIGRLFGLQDKNKTTLDTSKYNKGPVPFDGVTKKAIVEVIPALLAKIESAITGRDEKVFDYESGKWTTGSAIIKNLKEKKRSIVRNATGDVRSFINSAADRVGFANYDEKKLFDEELETFLTAIYNKGGFYNVRNPGKAIDYGISDKNFKRFNALWKNMPREVQMALGGQVQSSRNSTTRQFEEMEKNTSHIYNAIFSGRKLTENVTIDKYGNVEKSKTFGKRDKYRNDDLYYLREMFKELSTIRAYQNIIANSPGIRGMILYNGGGGGGGNTSTNNKIAKEALKHLNRRYNFNPNTVNFDGSKNPVETIAQKVSAMEERNRKAFVDRETRLTADAKKHKKERPVLNNEDETENIFALRVASRQEADDYERHQTDTNYGAKSYREYKENAKKTLAKGLNPKELTGNFTKRFTAAKDLSTKWAVITDSIGEMVSKPAEYISEKLTAASNTIYEFLFETEKEASPGKRVKGFFNLITEKTNIMFNKMVSRFEEKIWDPLKEKLGLDDAKSYLKKFGSAVGNSFMSKARGLGNIVADVAEDLTREPDQNAINAKLAKEYNEYDTRRLGRFKKDQMGRFYLDNPNEYIDKFARSGTGYTYTDKYGKTNYASWNSILEDPDLMDAVIRYNQNNNNLSFVDLRNPKTVQYQAPEAIQDIQKAIDSVGGRTQLSKGQLTYIAKHPESFQNYNINGILSNSDNKDRTKAIALFKATLADTYRGKILQLNEIIKTGTIDYGTGGAPVPVTADELYDAILELKNITSIIGEDQVNRILSTRRNSAKAKLDYQDKIQEKAELQRRRNAAKTKKTKVEEPPIEDITNVNDVNANANGARYITKSGLTTISKGEMIIPSELNPFNPDRGRTSKSSEINNERRISKQYAKNIADQALQGLGMNAEGSLAVQNLNDKNTGLIARTRRVVTGALDRFFVNGDSKTAADVYKDLKKNSSMYIPEALGGGGLGAILGLVTGLGPMAGLVIGAGASIANKSDFIKNWLFGEQVDEKDGGGRKGGALLSRKQQKMLTKMIPDIKKFGVLGAGAGLVGLAPFGILGGLALGGAAAYAKSNSRFMEYFFGDENGIINNKRKNYLKKIFPKAAIGTAAAMAFGPFGLIGSTILGTTASIVTSSETFNRFMFGQKMYNGKRVGGLVGTLKKNVVDPLADFAKDFAVEMKDFMKNDIFKPIAAGVGPLLKYTQLMISDIGHAVGDGLKKVFAGFKGSWIINAVDKLTGGRARSIFDATAGRAFRGAKNVSKGLISFLPKQFGKFGDRLQRNMIASGRERHLDAAGRIAWMNSRGIKDYANKEADMRLLAMNSDQIEDFNSLMTAISGEKDFDAAIKEDRRDIYGNLKNLLGEDQAETVIRLLEQNDPESQKAAMDIISKNGKFEDAADQKKFLQFINGRSDRLRRNLDYKNNFNQYRGDALNKVAKVLNVDVSKLKDKKYVRDILARTKTELDSKRTNYTKEAASDTQKIIEANTNDTDRVVSAINDLSQVIQKIFSHTDESNKAIGEASVASEQRAAELVTNRKSNDNARIKRVQNIYGTISDDQKKRIVDIDDPVYGWIDELYTIGYRFPNIKDAFEETPLSHSRTVEIINAIKNNGTKSLPPRDMANIKYLNDAQFIKLRNDAKAGIDIRSIEEYTKLEAGQSARAKMLSYFEAQDIKVDKSLSDTALGVLYNKQLENNKAKPKVVESEQTTADGTTQKVKTIFNEYGAMKYVMSTDGSWDLDTSDANTKEAIAKRDASANAVQENTKAMTSVSGFFSKLFGRDKKKDEEDSKGGFLSKIFGKIFSFAGPILGFGAKWLMKGLIGGGKLFAVTQIGKFIGENGQVIGEFIKDFVEGACSAISSLWNNVIPKLPGYAMDVAKSLGNGLFFNKKATSESDIKEALANTTRHEEYNPMTGRTEVYYTDNKTGERIDVELDANGNVKSVGSDSVWNATNTGGRIGMVAAGAGYLAYKTGLAKKAYGAVKTGVTNMINRKIGNRLGFKLGGSGTTGDPATDAIIESQNSGTEEVSSRLDTIIDLVSNAVGADSVLDNVKDAIDDAKDAIDGVKGKSTPKRNKVYGIANNGKHAGKVNKVMGVLGKANKPSLFDKAKAFGSKSWAKVAGWGSKAVGTASSASSNLVGIIMDKSKSIISRVGMSATKAKIFTKLAAKAAPKIALRLGTAATGVLAPLAGILVAYDVAKSVSGFILNYAHPEKALGIPDGSVVTEGAKFIAGACGALGEFVGIEPNEIYAFFGEDAVADADKELKAEDESNRGSVTDSSNSSSGSSSSNSNVAAPSSFSQKLASMTFANTKIFGDVFGAGKYGKGYFKQTDPRYKNMRFNTIGDTEYQNMADSGCGPVAAVNAIYGRGPNPVEAAQFALNGGYKERNGGTRPEFFKSYFNAHGKEADFTNGRGILNNLRAGNPVVMMGQSNKIDSNTPYGTGPHYVTATGLDSNGNMIIQDPQDNRSNIRYPASSVLAKTKFGVAARGRYGRGGRMTMAQAKLDTVGYKTLDQIQAKYKGSSSAIIDTPDGMTKGGSKNKARDLGKFIWDYLLQVGYTESSAAGIMGNLMVESGLDPRRVQGRGWQTADEVKVDGNTGYGLCQWTYDARQQGLADFAKSYNKKSSDLVVQLDYMMKEVQQGYTSCLPSGLNACKTPEDAAAKWCNEFENPGVPHLEERTNWARKIFEAKGVGITKLTYDGNTVSGIKGVVGGSAGGSSAKAGFLGLLEKMASPIMGIYNSVFGGNIGSSSGGSYSPSSASYRNWDGSPLKSSVTPQGVSNAISWAKSRENTPGYGNNGCTEFVRDFIKQSGNPLADNFPMWVPDLYKASNDSKIFKQASQGGKAGDIAILETNRNPGDGPDHVVIADGSGGYFGNSSSRNRIVHGDIASDFGSDNIVGYVSTGDPDGISSTPSGTLTRSQEEVIADAGTTSGSGKYGRGKYSKARSVQHMFGKGPSYTTYTSGTNYNSSSNGNIDYTPYLQEIIKALYMIVTNTDETPQPMNAGEVNTANVKAEQRQNAMNRLRTGLQKMAMATSGNGLGPISGNNASMESLIATMTNLATK